MIITTGAGADELSGSADTAGAFLTGFARPAGWGRPFWADINPTLVSTELSLTTNSPEYDWAQTDETYRFFLFANLGVNLPIWSGDFSGGKFSLCLAAPFIISVWLDVFEPVTAPVINTDYRAGAPGIAFLHRFRSPFELFPRWRVGIYNYSFLLSPFIHESTHIGDELTIYRKDDQLEITRVNVSYNFSEFVLTVNDPENSLRMNHAFRFGLMLLHNVKKGWYSIIPEEADDKNVIQSHIPFETYFQYQFQSDSFGSGFQFILSWELRIRERYNYPFSYSSEQNNYFENGSFASEALRQSCLNIFAGVRYNNPESNYFSRTGLGIRAYTGINPHGQFRSQLFYNQWGIVILFE